MRNQRSYCSDLELLWAKEESLITEDRLSHEYSLVWGEKRESFYEKHGPILLNADERARLLSLKNKFIGERIFILGNGPSLNKTPLDLLGNEYTFVTNRAYLLFDRIKWRPTFYTALDWRVVPDVAHEINLLSGIMCFFEKRFQGLLRGGSDVYWYTHTSATDVENRIFSYNIEDGLRGAGSVIGACVQIAFYLGFRDIYLIGCDLGYKVGASVVQHGEDKFGNGVKLHLTSTVDDDPNHFDPRYFGVNRRWHDPNVKRMISGHEQCLKGVMSSGGQIFNATIGGELEVYPRVDFMSLFSKRNSSLNPRAKICDLINNIKPLYHATCDHDCLIGEFLRCEKAHLDETNALFEFLIDNNGCMIDVGAHRGSSSIPFLDRGWKIFAFEPDENNRAVLTKRISNHVYKSRFTLDIRCVSNTSECSASFFTSEQSSGISGLSPFHETHVESQKVDITTLTDFFQDKPMPNVDFLKIDTEGHDLFVLQGYPWDRGLPMIIECEFEDAKSLPLGYSFKDIADFLVSKGYTVYVSEWHPIIRYGIRHEWKRLVRYPCDLSDPKGWGNLLAFRDRIDEKLFLKSVHKVLKFGMFEQASVSSLTKEPGLQTAFNHKISSFSQRVKIQSNPSFSNIGSHLWRYTHTAGSHRLWIAEIDVPNNTSNRTFVGVMRLHSNKLIEVDVSLARHNKSSYEGVRKRVKLFPGEEQTLRLSKCFHKAHAKLKMQVEIVDFGSGKSAELGIEVLGVNETLSSIRRRVGEQNLNLRYANRIFRDGDIDSALGIYVWLSQNSPMSMYGFNAVLSARRLGMRWVMSAGQLAHILE